MQWFQVLKTGPWIGPVFTTRAAKKTETFSFQSQLLYSLLLTHHALQTCSPPGLFCSPHRLMIDSFRIAPGSILQPHRLLIDSFRIAPGSTLQASSPPYRLLPYCPWQHFAAASISHRLVREEHGCENQGMLDSFLKRRNWSLLPRFLVIDSRDLGVIDSPVRSRLLGKVIRVTKSPTHRLMGRSAKSEPPTAVRAIDPDHPV